MRPLRFTDLQRRDSWESPKTRRLQVGALELMTVEMAESSDKDIEVFGGVEEV